MHVDHMENAVLLFISKMIGIPGVTAMKGTVEIDASLTGRAAL